MSRPESRAGRGVAWRGGTLGGDPPLLRLQRDSDRRRKLSPRTLRSQRLWRLRDLRDVDRMPQFLLRTWAGGLRVTFRAALVFPECGLGWARGPSLSLGSPGTPGVGGVELLEGSADPRGLGKRVRWRQLHACARGFIFVLKGRAERLGVRLSLPSGEAGRERGRHPGFGSERAGADGSGSQSPRAAAAPRERPAGVRRGGWTRQGGTERRTLPAPNPAPRREGAASDPGFSRGIRGRKLHRKILTPRLWEGSERSGC